MPIETDSEAWRGAEPIEESVFEQTIEFLSEHEGEAFADWELADELMNTDWFLYYEREEEIARIGRDEFYDRKEEGEYDGKYDNFGFGQIYLREALGRMTVYLNILRDRGVVEVRQVPTDQLEHEYDEQETHPHYTYSG